MNSSNESQWALAEDEKIPVGISACILGEKVRYDGGHKRNHFITETLGAYVAFVPVCPEVGMGLSIPRPTMRLEKPRGAEAGAIRLVTPKTGTDHTIQMARFAKQQLADLEQKNLCGYILQKGSPSCGMERVRVYPPGGGMAQKNGRGLFAQALVRQFPYLPVEEDGRLNDPRLRENFVARIFAYRRLRMFFDSGWKRGDLVTFHTNEKMLMLSHDRPTYTEMGRLVAHAKEYKRSEIVSEYHRLFLTGLKKIATPGKQSDVLHHIAGHFKKVLDSADRLELKDVIDAYRAGLVPLVVPVTLLRHHVRKHNMHYLAAQTFLNPHPRELMLRNHV